MRASLGAEEGLVFGGSEDGKVYIWHRRETQVKPSATGGWAESFRI